ncbi:MAG: hypothetical protein L0Y38_10615 [Methylococcaceae bacterium]|nr:hypothetical protein [Methylococcaceae bacterium]
MALLRGSFDQLTQASGFPDIGRYEIAKPIEAKTASRPRQSFRDAIEKYHLSALIKQNHAHR